MSSGKLGIELLSEVKEETLDEVRIVAGREVHGLICGYFLSCCSPYEISSAITRGLV